MGKRIIFCADGTWDDSSSNSNVYRFFKALQTKADQMPFYDDGVGADGRPLNKVVCGLLGAGLFQKIKDGYTKISQVYEQGDEIFLIGFSRGAYTVRCLSGMITACGLPTANFTDDVVNNAFDAYRDKYDRAKRLADLNKTCTMFSPKITMIGVWDTVGSLGIPAVVGGVDPIVYGFLDTGLHPNVLNAYHALAIDERRCEFPATLWNNPAPGQTLEQVWFCGVHCDVGGGYGTDQNGTALSDLTLAWMIGKAAALGVAFAAGIPDKYALPMEPKNALDTKHESWSILWTLPRPRTIPPNAWIADSVYVRCQHDTSYRPANLTFTAGAPASSYQGVPIVSAAKSAAGV